MARRDVALCLRQEAPWRPRLCPLGGCGTASSYMTSSLRRRRPCRETYLRTRSSMTYSDTWRKLICASNNHRDRSTTARKTITNIHTHTHTHLYYILAVPRLRIADRFPYLIPCLFNPSPSLLSKATPTQQLPMHILGFFLVFFSADQSFTHMVYWSISQTQNVRFSYIPHRFSV